MANEWTLYVNSQGNGITLVPTDCQPIANFDDKFVEGKFPLSSPFYIEDGFIKNHAVDLDLFKEPFPSSCWHYASDLSSLINNGMEVSNFEEPYNYNSWYMGINGEKVLNTGLEPANFETPYNWVAWYLDNNPDGEFDMNTGPWEELMGAFANDKSINSINIPDNITKLGMNTFRRSSLEIVDLNENTKYSDEYLENTFPDDISINKR